VISSIEDTIRNRPNHDSFSQAFEGKHLAHILNVSESLISETLSGKFTCRQDSFIAWKRCAQILRVCLLGDYAIARASLSPDDLRERISLRMEEYFFGRELSQLMETDLPPFYFICAGNGAPQRLEEARYQMLWLAHERFTRAHTVRSYLVSGGLPFRFTGENEVLTDTGNATMTALMSGVQIHLVVLDPTVISTPAYESAEAFKRAIERVIGSHALPEYSQYLFSDKSETALHALCQRSPQLLRIVAVDPYAKPLDAGGTGARPAVGPKTTPWAGAFFSPILRYTFSELLYDGKETKRRLFLLQGLSSHPNRNVRHPFASRIDNHEAFTAWRDVFIPTR
jgi:hypothetical protein